MLNDPDLPSFERDQLEQDAFDLMEAHRAAERKIERCDKAIEDLKEARNADSDAVLVIMGTEFVIIMNLWFLFV